MCKYVNKITKCVTKITKLRNYKTRKLFVYVANDRIDYKNEIKKYEMYNGI